MTGVTQRHVTSDTMRRIYIRKAGIARRFTAWWPGYTWTIDDNRDFQCGIVVEL